MPLRPGLALPKEQQRIIRIYMDMKAPSYISLSILPLEGNEKEGNLLKKSTPRGRARSWLIRIDDIVKRLDGYINPPTVRWGFTTEITSSAGIKQGHLIVFP